MSKKNNKSRHKQYVVGLKQIEAEQSRTRLLKQQQRDANRICGTMLDDIGKIKIKDEKDEKEDEDEKMDVEVVQPSYRKKRKAYRHKKSKRFN